MDGGIFGLSFTGGRGNDQLVGSYARDDYYFDRGDGHDVIFDDVRSMGADVSAYFAANPQAEGYQDSLHFGEGIGFEDLAVARSGQDLVLAIGDSDSVTIQDYFDGTRFNQIETIGFADGSQLVMQLG